MTRRAKQRTCLINNHIETKTERNDPPQLQLSDYMCEGFSVQQCKEIRTLLLCNYFSPHVCCETSCLSE